MGLFVRQWTIVSVLETNHSLIPRPPLGMDSCAGPGNEAKVIKAVIINFSYPLSCTRINLGALVLFFMWGSVLLNFFFVRRGGGGRELVGHFRPCWFLQVRI